MSRTTTPRLAKRGRLLMASIVVIAAVQAASPQIATGQPNGKCPAVFFLGARGSDEKLDSKNLWNASNLGGPVKSFYDRVAAAVGIENVQLQPTIYPAAAVSELITPVTTPWLTSAFQRSMDDGVKAVMRDLEHTAWKIEKGGCGNAQIVLSGYSQGAMVMHRVILQLAKENTALSRTVFKHLTAAYLIADGHRVPNDNMTYEGSAVRSEAGIVPLYEKFPDWLAGRIYNICDYDDIVCSTNPTTIFLRDQQIKSNIPLVSTANNWWVDRVLGVYNGLTGQNQTPPNPMSPHENYGQRANSGTSATKIASTIKAKKIAVEPKRGNSKPPASTPTPTPTPIPRDLVCRDLPGTANDVTPWDLCARATDTSSATLHSDEPSRFGPPIFGGGNYFGLVDASNDSRATMRLNSDANGTARADGGSSVDVLGTRNAAVEATATQGSTVKAVADRSGIIAEAGNSSKIDGRASNGAFGELSAQDRSTLTAILDAAVASLDVGSQSTMAATITDSQVDLSGSDGSSTTVGLSGGSTVMGVARSANAQVTVSGGSTVNYDASSGSDLSLSATNGSAVDARASVGGRLSARLDGATAALEAFYNARLSVDARGHDVAVSALASGGANIDVKVVNAGGSDDFTAAEVWVGGPVNASAVAEGTGSTLQVHAFGDDETVSTTVPVLVAVAKNSGTTSIVGGGPLTQSTILADGAQVTASSTGPGSFAEIDGYLLVGTITVTATKGGHAYYYSDIDNKVTFGCIGGVTSVRSDAGSCDSDGTRAVYRYTDGREEVVEQSQARTATAATSLPSGEQSPSEPLSYEQPRPDATRQGDAEAPNDAAVGDEMDEAPPVEGTAPVVESTSGPTTAAEPEAPTNPEPPADVDSQIDADTEPAPAEPAADTDQAPTGNE